MVRGGGVGGQREVVVIAALKPRPSSHSLIISVFNISSKLSMLPVIQRLNLSIFVWIKNWMIVAK